VILVLSVASGQPLPPSQPLNEHCPQQSLPCFGCVKGTSFHCAAIATRKQPPRTMKRMVAVAQIHRCTRPVTEQPEPGDNKGSAREVREAAQRVDNPGLEESGHAVCFSSPQRCTLSKLCGWLLLKSCCKREKCTS
jgi:hypothetical protein